MKQPLLIIAFIFIQVFFYSCINNASPQQNASEPFNRNEQHLIFTKHAKCRMDCRHINEEEIKEVLHDGNINYGKSNLNDKRGATYALEGYTKEHQHLRIIVDPKTDGLVIVTCIDLNEEWQCDCN